MRAPMLFYVTNFLGFTKKVIVYCQSFEEGKERLFRTEEYPPMEIIFGGMIWDKDLWNEVDVEQFIDNIIN